MKKILFKKLTVKNFLSIGSAPITIDFTQGINLITGINLDKEDASNGSGKSSLINAIYFCLYGKALKDLKIDQIPNSYTKGICEVSLVLDIEHSKKTDQYVITRTLRPSKLKLEKNGEDITKSTIAKTSELLQVIVNCSSTVFEKSIVMDANNATNFMSQKKVEKRKFLEGILNLNVFGDMLGVARTDYNTTKYDFDVLEAKLQDSLQTLETYEVQSEKLEQQNIERQETINNKITNLQQEADTLRSTLRVEISQEDLIKVQNKIEKLNEKKSDNNSQIKESIKQEAFYEQTEKTLSTRLSKLLAQIDVCIECDRPYTEVDKNTITEKQKSTRASLKENQQTLNEIKATIAEIESQQIKIDQSILKLSQKQRLAQNILDHNKNIHWKLQRIEQSIQELETEIHSPVVNEYKQIIQEQSIKVEQTREEVDNLNTRLEVLQAAKFILSEEGVRSYIVKKILCMLNSKLNKYLRRLDANAKCEFNEYFEETLWDQYGNERSYYNFSSGEQRRIDLSILFAFQDIRRLQADVSMNISIYDELLDSSLDRKGAELVMHLLKERAHKNQECVYIVSHRKEAQNSHISQVITLQKRNGITSLV